MDEGIKASIQARYTPISDYFNISGAAETKVQDLFARIEQLGESCADQADFEQQFAVSPLNDEYMNIFTALAPYVKKPDGAPTMGQHVRDTVLGTAASSVMHNVEMEASSILINSVPDEVSDVMIHKENVIPGVLEAKTAGNLAHMLGIRNPFKKKKNEEE